MNVTYEHKTAMTFIGFSHLFAPRRAIRNVLSFGIRNMHRSMHIYGKQ